MQAIILAAGIGKRLGELTKDNTKCMMPINGECLIDRVIKQLSRLHLSRLIIVVGYEGQKLMDYIGDRYSDTLKIEYICNPIYDKTNNIYSLALAKDEMCKEDTLLLESDIIFEDAMLKLLVEHPDRDLALIARYEPWMDGTMVTINEQREILDFVSKETFSYQHIDKYYKTVNIYKFSKEFSARYYVPFLEAYCKVMGNNEYYEQVLRVLCLLRNSPLKALPITEEKWYEIDDVQDLDIATTLFASDDDRSQLYHRRYGGYWRFNSLLDFCYLVNPYFPTERMKEEIKANFDVLLQNYPSGMYVNSLLAGKYFGVKADYMVVGNGAAELIKVVMEQHCDGKVGVIYPTFDEYPNRLGKDHIEPFIVTSDDYGYTADDLIAFYADKEIDLLLLVNPDNPSGHFMPVSDVLRLCEWCCGQGIRLLLDESFVDFTDDFEHNSLLDNRTLEAHPNLMIMKSISKSYGVPGLRLGIFASADMDIIRQIKKEVSIWNINSFAEFYMQIYGKYEKDYKQACRQFIETRAAFYRILQEVSFLRVIPSQANYFLCEVTDRYTSAELDRLLLKEGILISNCARKTHMDGRMIIRIAVRSHEDNERLVAALKRLDHQHTSLAPTPVQTLSSSDEILSSSAAQSVPNCNQEHAAQPKISVITSTYNSAATIRDTFESILAQTYTNYEVIVIDGASKDGTMDIVRAYAERFGDRLTYRSAPDHGLYDAMNKGYGMATGDIVGLLNSDDFYSSATVLERVAEAFTHNDVDAVYGDVHYVSGSDLSHMTRYYSSRIFRPALMRFGFMPAHPSFYCRRELLLEVGMFSMSYRIAADFDQMFRLLNVKRIRAKYLPIDFVTMREGGVSNAQLSSRMTIMSEHLKILRSNGVYSNTFLLSLRYIYKALEIIVSLLMGRREVPQYIGVPCKS